MKKMSQMAVLIAAALTVCSVPVTARADAWYEESGQAYETELEEGNDEFPLDADGNPILEEEDIRVFSLNESTYASASTVKTYSKAASGSTYLSKNFQVKEFACKDGTDTILIDSELVTVLQKIRDHFGAPLTITSGYRTASHNAAVGGASNSYHMKGMAADIKVQGVSPRQVAAYAELLGVRGIGLYSTWVHVDTRTSSSYFWNSEGSSTYEVSSFLSASAGSGDVNGDGIVNASDALLILQESAGCISLSQQQRATADLDGDSKVTAQDALYVLMRAAGI